MQAKYISDLPAHTFNFERDVLNIIHLSTWYVFHIAPRLGGLVLFSSFH